MGGKVELGESDIVCLEREINEEIGCKAKNPQYFATFEGPTHDGKQTIEIRCYFCELEGEIKHNPNDKVDGHLWLGKDYEKLGDQLAYMLRVRIIPELIKRGYL